MNILRQFTSVSSMLSALTPALLLAAAALAAPTAARGQSLPPEARSEELISLKFSDAPIEQVLDFYSQLTGRTLLQMPNINATITLRSQGMLSKDECLHAIESVLVMRNISLVPMGEKFLKVVQADQAAQVGMKIGTEDPDKPFAESDQMATQLIKLSHVAPSEVVGVIQSLLQGFGKIQVLERNNAILVTATSANILRTLELLEIVDQPIDMKIETRVYEINHASAAEIESKLEELVEQVQADQAQRGGSASPQPAAASPARTPPGVIRARQAAERSANAEVAISETGDQAMIRGSVKIVSDERTNILFVFSQPENFVFFDRIVDVLDRQVEPGIRTEVVALEYADAEEIATILNEFVGAASADSDSRGSAREGGETDNRSQALRDFIQARADQRTLESVAKDADMGRLSPDTKILADKRTNSILLMGRNSDISALMKVVENLDIILAQVLIEAVIVEVNLNKGVEYGIDWLQRSMTVYNQENRGPRGGISVNQPVFSFAGGQQMGEASNFQDAGTLTDRGMELASGGLSYYLTAYDFNLDAVIKMAASSDDARILSTPVILTTDNTEAKIVVGEQRPVVTSSSTTIGGEQRSAYEYKDIGINLSVTPRVNPGRYVVMEVMQNVDNVGGFETIDGNRVPIITRRELEAQIAVQSEQTVVMGGLVSTDNRKSRTRIPILSSIPVLGALFRADNNTNSRRELLVLLTPYVMFSPQETGEQTRRLHDASYSSQTEWHSGWSASPLAEDKKPGFFSRMFGLDEEEPVKRPEQPGFEGESIIKAPEPSGVTE
jgi:general secretion pathway protein D